MIFKVQGIRFIDLTAVADYTGSRQVFNTFTIQFDLAYCGTINAFESVGENRAAFGGLTMRRKGDALELQLRMTSRDGGSHWVPFNLRRDTGK